MKNNSFFQAFVKKIDTVIFGLEDDEEDLEEKKEINNNEEEEYDVTRSNN